ncbi:tetratricopeptide repeat protein [Elongatibacter sediminis]|uniref:Tetratricopeptide repeat protein n=1 Tax=Elongatibacter sediminis TaxID=3119006 RepID=A0AAW9RM88_9GAMM
MGFITELKRRNVVRMGVAYLLVAWLLLQGVDFTLEVIDAPGWILQVFVLAAAVGLPITLIFSWLFELTPEGVKRESQIDRTQSITPQTGHKLDRLIILALGLAVVVLLAERFVSGDPEPEPTPAPAPSAALATPSPLDNDPTVSDREPETPASSSGHERSVAVLPFVNMSSDPDQEYFSDGISEELLNVLVRFEGLRVPSRTSSFTFKDSGKKVAEIGRELNVDHVLEGSVRKSGNRVRVTAQLIDVNTDTHLWSDTYTRELDDIFEVQDEIARAIVGALEVTLGGSGQKALDSTPTENVEAYNKFLLGRHLWNDRSPKSLLAAVAPLREAVEMDPTFERAWAALADTFALIPEYNAGSIAEYVPLGRDAAERALQLDPDSARALTARAYIKAMYEYDIEGALADYRRALELEPTYATAHQWYGELLAVLLRTDEAIEALDQAARVDPLSAIIAHVKAWILLGAGRYDEARAQYAIARPMAPEMASMPGNLVLIETKLGNFEAARGYAREWGQLLNLDAEPSLRFIDAMENPALRPQTVQAILAREDMQDGAQDRAVFLMMLGDEAAALDSLERGFNAGDPYATHMNRMVIYDPLRDEPRFQAMLKKMNLWP